MSEAASDVCKRASLVQPPALGHQVEKISVPPIVPLFAKQLGRMRMSPIFT
jgi:hypothetical protein